MKVLTTNRGDMVKLIGAGYNPISKALDKCVEYTESLCIAMDAGFGGEGGKSRKHVKCPFFTKSFCFALMKQK